MEEKLKKRIKELEEENLLLKKKLREKTNSLEKIKEYNNRQLRYNSDYLPYYDDENR